jgi:P27 family predicted phage terminase small subunit
VGKRGPIGDSPELRRLKGRRVGVAERAKTDDVFVPRMPADLEPAARPYWRKYVPLIAAGRILQPVDVPNLEDMCRCFARLAEAEADIATRGLLVDGDRGKVKNPMCQLARMYRESLVKWSQKFGLSPSDRDRITFPAPPIRDPFEDLLNEPKPWEAPDDDSRDVLKVLFEDSAAAV